MGRLSPCQGFFRLSAFSFTSDMKEPTMKETAKMEGGSVARLPAAALFILGWKRVSTIRE